MEEKIIELFKRFEMPSENLEDGLRNMAIEKHNYEYLAQEIVKLFAIPVVSNNEVSVCDICENDKGLETYTLCHRCWDVANHH